MSDVCRGKKKVWHVGIPSKLDIYLQPIQNYSHSRLPYSTHRTVASSGAE